jgi:2-polyprenyl-3-methyl-5-hydroxy-6-metoxy-1,4-benzoquinol methylase
MILDNYLVFDRCPNCHSENIHEIGVLENNHPSYSSIRVALKYPRELWSCGSCESGFIQHIVDKQMSEKIYEAGDSHTRWNEESAFRDTKTDDLLSAIEPYLVRADSILDIGCNTGELLDYAKGYGCKTYGIELSAKARDVSLSKGHKIMGYKTVVGKKFDVITVFDVVEHIYDINDFLNLCENLLVKNGKLIVLTGNINSLPAKLSRRKWWYLTPAEHIVFPSEKYFSSLDGWRMVDRVRCYNSNAFLAGCWDLFKHTLMPMIRGSYSAYFAFMPDHVLFILEKNEV